MPMTKKEKKRDKLKKARYARITRAIAKDFEFTTGKVVRVKSATKGILKLGHRTIQVVLPTPSVYYKCITASVPLLQVPDGQVYAITNLDLFVHLHNLEHLWGKLRSVLHGGLYAFQGCRLIEIPRKVGGKKFVRAIYRPRPPSLDMSIKKLVARRLRKKKRKKKRKTKRR